MSEMKAEFNILNFDPSFNAYIEASAGTGKTYTIQRIVTKLIGMGTARLPEILLVTYTDKATGELKDRIRKILETAVGGGEGSKSLFKEVFGREKATAKELSCFLCALSDVDLASIYTIHSFCERVISSFAFETNSALTLAQTSDDAVKALVEKACRDEWPKDEEFQKIIAGDADVGKVLKKVTAAIQKYIPETTVLDAFSPEEAALFSEKEISEFVFAVGVEKKKTVLFKKYLKDLKSHAKEVDDKFSNKLSKFIDNLDDWDATKELCAGSAKAFFDTADGYACIHDACRFFRLAKEIAKDAKYMERIFIVGEVKCLYAEWQEYKRANKLQTFSDMILNVYNRVNGMPDSPLSAAIRGKYKFAVIDEFQDTNLLQWGIFSTVFLNQKDNHIFVVGDPKQSIYSFQGANVEVYRRAIAEIGTGYSLNTNYRSSSAMINACNTLFANENYARSKESVETDFGGAFPRSRTPDCAPAAATLNGSSFAPVWLSAPETDPVNFARFAVGQLAGFFKLKSGKTAMQLPDQDGNLRNIRYSDIAVLAKSRPEMAAVERELGSAGIPFLRYKDDALFSGRECAHWSALLRAIDTLDNSLRNQRVIRAALLTLFLRDSAEDPQALDKAEAFSFENEGCPFLTQLESWRGLARRKLWAQLLEQIYTDTRIEEKLNGPSYLQTLAKIRQIGDYIVNVLYMEGTSLEGIARHLENLHAKDEAAEQNAAYVAKGTDKDAVQVMTIHASKGLEFPIVIVPGGFKGEVQSAFVYLQDDPANGAVLPKRHIVFGHNEVITNSVYSEWHRLFYVAYTRAKHLLILPRYETEKKKSPDAVFIEPAIADIKSKIDAGELPGDNFRFFEPSENSLPGGGAYGKIFAEYESLLKQRQAESGAPVNATQVGAELSEIKKRPLYQWSTSYSQIAHSPGAAAHSEEGRTPDKEESPKPDAEIASVENFSNDCKPMITDPTFPRGTGVGTAIHSVFERSDFPALGNLPEAECLENGDLRDRIRGAFLENGLAVDKHPDWIDEVAGLVHRTLNAELPEICGGNLTGKTFPLKELPGENRRAEMMFQMNGSERWLCKGFLDLVFRRVSGDGVERYSILDWKSDSLGAYDADSIEAQIQKMNYNVQRVLYSYFLIRWLKGFFPKEENASIFENHFGGIYYVFFRGCQSGKSAGVYAKPFKDYDELETLYKEIIQTPMNKTAAGPENKNEL
jgi:exodeoxyribonuclease V beta subunit